MRTIASIILTSICLVTLSRIQPAASQVQRNRPGPEAVVAIVEKEGKPLLRGLENDTFNNKPTQPSSTGESKLEVAPGAEAVMTEDLLFVNPNQKAAPKSVPLKAFVGQSLTLNVEASDVSLDDLQGMMVHVVNETNRPLLLDGDNAQAVAESGSYKCASLVTVQKSVLPNKNGKALALGVFTKVVPAAVTVGVVPTVKDIKRIKQPIRLRYGPDELRRLAEASRFGQRILWPHQKTAGIVYFDSAVPLSGAKIEIPVQTLFDATDKTILDGVM